jgi:hypothetical protein
MLTATRGCSHSPGTSQIEPKVQECDYIEGLIGRSVSQVRGSLRVCMCVGVGAAPAVAPHSDDVTRETICAMQ